MDIKVKKEDMERLLEVVRGVDSFFASYRVYDSNGVSMSVDVGGLVDDLVRVVERVSGRKV
jgi:hypothetical protein